jgi:RNA polymerase sigma factor (sigma-70 family)
MNTLPYGLQREAMTDMNSSSGMHDMKYQYRSATGIIEIEISPIWYRILRGFDQMEQNNNRKETRRHLHCFCFKEEWIIIPDKSIYFELEEKDEIERLHKAINNLKPAQRLLIDLYYYKGFKQQDIANLLGVSQSDISCRLATTIKKLRLYF